MMFCPFTNARIPDTSVFPVPSLASLVLELCVCIHLKSEWPTFHYRICLKKSQFFLPFFSGHVVVSAPRFLTITNVSTKIIFFVGENYLVSLSICLSYKMYLYNNVNLLHFLNIVANAKLFVLVHFNFTCAWALKTPEGAYKLNIQNTFLIILGILF